jgi:hypothetical protein
MGQMLEEPVAHATREQRLNAEVARVSDANKTEKNKSPSSPKQAHIGLTKARVEKSACGRNRGLADVPQKKPLTDF